MEPDGRACEEEEGISPGWRDARKQTVFPWGDDLAGCRKGRQLRRHDRRPHARCCDRPDDPRLRRRLRLHRAGRIVSRRIRSASIDLSGNVQEWVEDEYSKLGTNLLGVLRGGGWNTYQTENLFTGSRNAVPPDLSGFHLRLPRRACQSPAERRMTPRSRIQLTSPWLKSNSPTKATCIAAPSTLPSGNTLVTDAPLDNNGRGQAFSPTDLVATALGSCMATVIGIVAKRKEIAVEGMTVTVRKFMSDDQPRRISRLELDLDMPLPATHPDRKLLESAARGCPVHHSIHPDIEVVMNWIWQD